MSNGERFFKTRERPEASGLSATLQHISGWPVLSITDSPQTLELKLTNRTPYSVTAGPATLRLIFRPGILTELDKLALAPQSEAQWVLALEERKPNEDVSVLLAGVDSFALAPGGAFAIRIDGISAAPAGGSRATRVEVGYSDFFHDSGSEIAGTRLIHMPVLRRHEPVGRPIKEIRTGSIAVSGPFTAGFTEGGDILNDGLTENRLKLRITSTSREPIPWAHIGDEATRFYLSFRTGDPGAQWGVLSSDGDHLGIERVEEFRAADDHKTGHAGWQVDNHSLRRNALGVLAHGDYVEVELAVHSKALIGKSQLVVTYENLPGYDDGDLVLLANLGGIADRPDSVEIVKPLHVVGDLQVDGVIATSQPFVTIVAKQFKVGGLRAKYYPVAFEDQNWKQGVFKLEILRSIVHKDKEWYGSLMAEITCHSSNYGHGSEFWSLEARQYRTHFIGGVINQDRGALHIIWLKGDTTYSWRSSGPARLYNSEDVLRDPQQLTLQNQVFPVKSEPDQGFNAMYISITKNGDDAPVTPVPQGAIIMWSGKPDAIPFGWALCDGTLNTPDLRERFVSGRGIESNDTPLHGKGDTHNHIINPPGLTTTSVGPKHDTVTIKESHSKATGITSLRTTTRTIKFNLPKLNKHTHKVNFNGFYSSSPNVEGVPLAGGVLRPKWYSLCYIMKLGKLRSD